MKSFYSMVAPPERKAGWPKCPKLSQWQKPGSPPCLLAAWKISIIIISSTITIQRPGPVFWLHGKDQLLPMPFRARWPYGNAQKNPWKCTWLNISRSLHLECLGHHWRFPSSPLWSQWKTENAVLQMKMCLVKKWRKTNQL